MNETLLCNVCSSGYFEVLFESFEFISGARTKSRKISTVGRTKFAFYVVMSLERSLRFMLQEQSPFSSNNL